MPTNLVRSRTIKEAPSKTVSGHDESRSEGGRIVLIEVGQVRLRVALVSSQTTERLWMMLPLFSTSEPWGDVVHFEIPVEIGRDRSARVNGSLGDVYLWAEEDRILVPFGATPLSKGSEVRLPWPCNVLGQSLDDIALLRSVRVGEKVSITRMT